MNRLEALGLILESDDLVYERVAHAQAVELMDRLDPELWAIQASRAGIVMYPRNHVHGITTWERTLVKQNFPIPAAWIGYLSAMHQLQMESLSNASPTSSKRVSTSPREVLLEKVQAADFSLTRFLIAMQEFSSDGHPTGEKSMLEKYQ